MVRHLIPYGLTLVQEDVSLVHLPGYGEPARILITKQEYGFPYSVVAGWSLHGALGRSVVIVGLGLRKHAEAVLLEVGDEGLTTLGKTALLF